MVLRTLLRYLANNEQLIQKLSESYPIKRAAQFMVSTFFRFKAITHEKKLSELTPKKLSSFIKNFKDNLNEELQRRKQN